MARGVRRGRTVQLMTPARGTSAPDVASGRRTTGARLGGLVAWLAIAFAAAAIGGIASAGAQAFYAGLLRPPWAPPAWLFGPVWTVLYAAMGVAAWLVWRDGGFAASRAALTLFLVQLAVNALWSWIFFAWRLGALAFAEILVLVALVGATIVLFWRKRALAGALMLPYFAWIVFASLLAYAVWQRNPALLG